jgi:hypothetical protein
MSKRPKTLREIFQDNIPNREILLAEGFDDAFIGTAEQFNKVIAVYDKEKCLKILHDRDGMPWEEALEYFDFNVTGAYMGALTPVFFTRSSLD